ncbi:molybdenum cofactor biosynthesis protein A [Psychromonas sp. CNPT3]|uniref:GTP 3',8-cyclase MoaA n=1 Tax=Psychromonas sp. CNPT3 TaxID=314282 RepID=UPI00006E481B|nr:GTP 3',8-cyclase MoaA [Psychromonas sp. CNPT3]AGH81241.1 molybdenum cofactor biosynthesis protein A [Psychromonas sp. CNPT3]
MQQQLIDNFERKFEYLRLSITDECNFKCNYCLPDGYQRSHQKSFLSHQEINNLVIAFAELGTKKVRITGGEPSLRKDFTQIIASVASVDGIEKVATTTNGFQLEKQAKDWFDAGLSAINISVDSLDANTFHLITGKNIFQKVMRGVQASLKAGYAQVKVNSVLMKGVNDNDLALFLNWIKTEKIQLRFIELMQTDDNDAFFNKYHLSGESIKARLLAEGWQQKQPLSHDGPAQVFKHPEYEGEIGLIMPYSKDFCKSCNRLRVSSTGRLHLCLFGEEGVDLRDLLGNSCDKEALKQRISNALKDKKISHYLQQGITGGTPHLASIGG